MECKKRKAISHGKRNKDYQMQFMCRKKRINTSLKDLSVVLINHGRYVLLSFLSSLPISVSLI